MRIMRLYPDNRRAHHSTGGIPETMMDKREVGRSGLEVSPIGPRWLAAAALAAMLAAAAQLGQAQQPAATAAPATVTNSIGMRFVRIPAGTTTIYSFGDDASQLARHAWFGESFATGGTHPAGQKPANPWGLHDIHGNVWEWVQDWYAADAYARGEAAYPADPVSGARRVVRGGSWHSTGDGWRSSARRDYDPDYRGISIGLRLVMAAE
jgi:formylglycine-generating enzyme required for sulfatase activity